MNVFFAALIVAGFIAAPSLLVWGWLRWIQRPKLRRLCPTLSLAGFLFAAASVLLAVSSVMYSFGVGGFRYYDPHLLKIFRWGILLSLFGIVLAMSGVWRPSSLRWHAPASVLGNPMFWIMAAEGNDCREIAAEATHPGAMNIHSV
jgi:hypothetical protein